MKSKRLPSVFIACVFALAGLSCTVVYHDRPRAPVHGHVVAYHGTEMVFDANLGLYVVTGYPRYYFHEGYYYRVHYDGLYERCRRIDGPWSTVRPSKLPPGIAMKYGEHARKHSARRRG